MDDTLKDSWDNSQDPISKQIKKRIEKTGDRYHCNDNISKHKENGLLTITPDQIETKTIDKSKTDIGIYFKRELYSVEKNVYPIHFAIPKKKIISSINLNPKNILSPLIPGKMETYIYEKENKYYEMYQDSIFSLTYKKNGWDCLRHYEILANGSIPLFIKLDDCPDNTLTSLPKKKLLKFFDLYNKILNYYKPLKIYKKRFRDIRK